VSERFTCRVTGQHRTTQRHQPGNSTPADPDAGLRQWLRDYAAAHPRLGHRRAYHDARGEGWQVNHNWRLRDQPARVAITFEGRIQPFLRGRARQQTGASVPLGTLRRAHQPARNCHTRTGRSRLQVHTYPILAG
jgi:hypothetical protein